MKEAVAECKHLKVSRILQNLLRESSGSDGHTNTQSLKLPLPLPSTRPLIKTSCNLKIYCMGFLFSMMLYGWGEELGFTTVIQPRGGDNNDANGNVIFLPAANRTSFPFLLLSLSLSKRLCIRCGTQNLPVLVTDVQNQFKSQGN